MDRIGISFETDTRLSTSLVKPRGYAEEPGGKPATTKEVIMEPERDELGRVCGSDGGVIPEDYSIEERDDDGDEDDY